MKKIFIALSVFLLIFIFSLKFPENLPKNDDLFHKIERSISKKLLDFNKRDYYCGHKIPLSSEKIDVVILSDFNNENCIARCIESIGGLVMHPLNKIYVVHCEKNEKVISVCREKNCEFIKQSEISDSKIFLMFNLDKVVKSKYYLVVNANTMFLQNQIFIKNEKQLINVFKNYSLEKKNTVKNLLNIKKHFNFGFSGSHMFFNKDIVNELKNEFVKLHGENWQEILLNKFNKKELDEKNFCCMEFYASYCVSRYKSNLHFANAKDVILPKDKIDGLEWIRGFIAGKYKTVNFL